jgi:hypothetical protein
VSIPRQHRASSSARALCIQLSACRQHRAGASRSRSNASLRSLPPMSVLHPCPRFNAASGAPLAPLRPSVGGPECKATA